MRTTQLRPPATSVFTSKRFVVALCAAIAMVLGAMSVGSNAPPTYEEPAVAAPPSVANRAGAFMQDSGNKQGQAEATAPLAQPYLQYQMPVPPDNSGSLPVANSPAKNLEIKLNLKSLEASITPPSAVLRLEVDNPLLKTDVSVDASATIDQVLQDAGTPAEDTVSQPAEPAPEDAPDAPTE